MRILFLHHPGTNSRDIFTDIIDGYREAGHDLFALELGPLWNYTNGEVSDEIKAACLKLFSDTVVSCATANRIDLCISLWANGTYSLDKPGGQQSLFEWARLPILMHWLDAPQWAHDGKVLQNQPDMLNGPCSYHYINNAGTAREMEGVLGFSNVICLPNAASPTRFRPFPEERKDFDIVFGIGDDQVRPTPLMLAELEKDEPDVQAIREEAARALRPELTDIAHPVWESAAQAQALVDIMLRQRLADRDVEIVQQLSEAAHQDRTLAPGALSLLKEPQRFVNFSMVLRRMENWERAFTFAYLSRYFRCATFGSEAFGGWPKRWEYLGHLPYAEQARAYSRSRFGLNVMRWQDDRGLNLKPFEITLSGACLLQAYRQDIEELFTADEMVLFRGPADARRKAADLLKHPDRIERIAAAGRARSLREHCWKHRAEAVTRLLLGPEQRSAAAGRVGHLAHPVNAFEAVGASALRESSTDGSNDPSYKASDVPIPDTIEAGEWLVFVLGLWRSGTTLLRKVLDSHSQVYSPAETWFLLPLLNLWNGQGTAETFNPGQAAAALRGHLNLEQFLTCCRSFASRFYRQTLPPTARYFVDKTPFYVEIADMLPRLFPKARFIVLTRDPRGVVWSRHTWRHIQSTDAQTHFTDVAEGTARLGAFLRQYSDRCLHVRYEGICTTPDDTARQLCDFLRLPYEPAMVEYGAHEHHEGFGDEKSRRHARPNTDTLERWAGPDGLTLDQQSALARLCGPALLRQLGHSELETLASPFETASV